MRKEHSPLRVTRVYSHGLARAQRYALSSLMGSDVRGVLPDCISPAAATAVGELEWQNYPAATKIVQGMLTVATRWRARVARLREAGWLLPRSPATWKMLVACPPVSISTSGEARWGCRRYLICPFCWARQYVRDLYLAIEYACYGVLTPTADVSSEEAEMRRYAYDLAVLTTKYSYPPEFSVEEILACLKREHAQTKVKRDLAVHAASGGYLMHSFEPAVNQKGDNVWVRTTRSLLLLSPHMELSEECDNAAKARAEKAGATCEGVKLRRYYSVSRDNISAAVGVACLYPPALFYGSAEMICEYLNKRKNSSVRLSDVFGDLRNATKRKRAEQLRREQLRETRLLGVPREIPL